MKKVKIYTYGVSKELGGGITYLQAFIDYYHSLSYKIDIVDNATSIFRLGKQYKRINHLLPFRILNAAYRILTDLFFYDIIIFKSNVIPPLSLNKVVFLIVDFPQQIKLSILDDFKLNRVNQVICNSFYTAYWIDLYWKKKSFVIYPLSIDSIFDPDKKNLVILSVGRFVDNQRSKRQDILINAFKIIIDQGYNLTLKLVGFCQDEAYLGALKRLAEGYPVEFLTAVDDKDLHDFYRLATFYWHACGFGVDAAIEPSRIEHFGISVADALGFGCIPMVYSNGGPFEIIDGGEYGIIWHTPDDLARRTIAIIQNSGLKKDYQTKAQVRSARFNKKTFFEKMDNLMHHGR